jgi:hypothetical protein
MVGRPRSCGGGDTDRMRCEVERSPYVKSVVKIYYSTSSRTSYPRASAEGMRSFECRCLGEEDDRGRRREEARDMLCWAGPIVCEL